MKKSGINGRHRWLRISSFVPAGVFAASGTALLLAGRCSPAFADWYRGHVYRGLSEIFCAVSGIFPFSVSEIGIYTLAVIAGADCVRCVLPGKRREKLGRYGIRLLTGASVLWFLYAANCGVNYYSRAFSETAGLTVGETSAEELTSLCRYLVENIREQDAILGISSAEDGQTENTNPTDFAYFREQGERCREAMTKLGEEYPALEKNYPAPKPILGSHFFTVQQITGIYSPFTVEANVNTEIPYYNIPFTMCHELSHLSGFMREDEANFIAFLACIGSDDPETRRSGYLSGWVYAGNALAAAAPEAFSDLYGSLSDADRQDLSFNNEFWAKYNGKAAETHEKMNDQYLKANGQTEGTESYGHVVDLMLAWYKKEGG